MNENEYTIARQNMIPIPCVFEKSILSCRVACVKSNKKNLAEREVICCSTDVAQSVCKTWLTLLRQKAQFSLQIKDINNASDILPHAKEMKVQVGGIHGLAGLLNNYENNTQTGNKRPLYDVFNTLDSCIQKYGKLEQFPFDEIVKSVACFKLR